MSFEFRISKSKDKGSEFIRVQKGKAATGRVNIVTFVDKDTRQHVVYTPSLEISGYGETKKKADEMFLQELLNFYSSLVAKTKEQVDAELGSLGWRREKFLSKQFSRLSVDEDGRLSELNADESTIERHSVLA